MGKWTENARMILASVTGNVMRLLGVIMSWLWICCDANSNPNIFISELGETKK